MGAENLSVNCNCTPVVDAEYRDGDELSPSEVIIDAIAEAAGSEPAEVPTLYEYVDPDAIDALFERHDGSEDAEAVLGFTVDAWNVFVRADGKVRVCDGTHRAASRSVFAGHSV